MEYHFEGVKILHEFGIKIQSQKINRKYFESYQSNQLRQCLLWSWWAFQVILKLAHKHQLWSPGNLPSLRGQHNKACACKRNCFLVFRYKKNYLDVCTKKNQGRCNLIFFDVLTWDIKYRTRATITRSWLETAPEYYIYIRLKVTVHRWTSKSG